VIEYNQVADCKAAAGRRVGVILTTPPVASSWRVGGKGEKPSVPTEDWSFDPVRLIRVSFRAADLRSRAVTYVYEHECSFALVSPACGS
jgi:hypothetical protein